MPSIVPAAPTNYTAVPVLPPHLLMLADLLELAQAGEPVSWPSGLSEDQARNMLHLHFSSINPASSSSAELAPPPPPSEHAQTGTAVYTMTDVSILVGLAELEDAGEPVLWPAGLSSSSARDIICNLQGAAA